ncbi:MAG: S9 family peptidase [Bacteroidetes bacterium SB0662_bin_6]|nr:S9 family peptidase [Bacteroidetes bacterium SB0668_bin_1]MYE04815.1 S9 family peptidase [Bacteroidetes bacterium SB0662_bin_6]
MYRSISICLFAALLPAAAVAQETETPMLTLEDIHASGMFVSASFQGGKWAGEGPVVTFVEQDGEVAHLIRYDLETEQREFLVDGETLYAPDAERTVGIDGYAYSPDGSAMLIYTDSEQVWRYNTKGYYYLYDLAAQELTPIARREDGFQMFAKFSPDGRRVAFVRNRDLFVVDLADMSERRLTDDGAPGRIINGTSDWVYEEEFGLRDGWAWSPDGARIAYVQLDESDTREFAMADLRAQYPEIERFRYPKAGEANSEIRVGVVDVMSGERRFFDTGTWRTGEDDPEYIPSLGWTPEVDGMSYVWFFRLNREQNRVDVLYGSPEDMSTRLVLREENDTWIDVETSFGDLAGGTITYLDDDRHFVWMSERDGYRHLYLYENDGTFVRQLTHGAWNVTSFHGIALDRDAIFFTATEASPLERQLYRVSFGDSDAAPVRITERSGSHSIDMSPDLRYYIDRFTNVRMPLSATLHQADGTLVKVLEDNAALRERLAAYNLPEPEFIEAPGSDGTMLNAWMLKPTDFDASRQYPLLLYVYGGPGSQTVRNTWGGSRYLWHAYLVEEYDMIIASVDNRGTGGRSKGFKSATYERLGILEAEDQIASAKHFSALPYIDGERTGMWGWSYGGFMTLMSMLYEDGPDTFELGVSVAPVTSWRQYDTIYTERYMSTPQRNEQGYRNSAPVTWADRLRDNQDLLIIHGDLDDNVHFQNTVQMADALQQAGKQFDLMMYPGRNHGIYGGMTRLHLYTLITDYIADNL